MKDIAIAFIQAPFEWENKEKNISYFESKITEIVDPCDIIILPEMFNTGFTMNSTAMAESMDGDTMQWLRKTAQSKQVVICGSLIISDGSSFYNRMVWVQPDGKIISYDKRHLFRMAHENTHFEEGRKIVIVDYMGWRINLMVCYDLRFPVWSRRTQRDDYDILIYVANWPEIRSFAWRSLLVARAIENQSYVIGLNRIGEDGNKINYSGNSVALNYLGEAMHTLQSNQEAIGLVKLSKTNLESFRANFPAHLDADHFDLHP